MALYVYDQASGALVSWAPNDTDPVATAADLAAGGLVVVKGLTALDASHAWDPASKTVIAVTAAQAPVPIGTGKWILRFTPTEFQTISASTDPTVQQFMYALNHTTDIDLADPVITNGVAYLVSINLLASPRIAAILAKG